MKMFVRLMSLNVFVITVTIVPSPLTFISPSSFPLTISSPGLYVLTDNVSFSQSSTAITITTDDVTLDLQGKTIRANGVSTNGIVILSESTTTTRENIVIKNGTLSGFDCFGVTGSGTLYRNIKLHDITVLGVADTSTGILFANTTDSMFERCGSENNHTGGLFDTCRDIKIYDSQFNNNVATTTVIGFQANNCDTFMLVDCQVNNNVATNGDAVGASLIGTGSGWLIKNCSFSNNRANNFPSVDERITSTPLCLGLTASVYHGCHVVNCAFNDNATTNTFASQGARGMYLLTCTAWHIEDSEFVRMSIGGSRQTVEANAPDATGAYCQEGGGHVIERCNFSGGLGGANVVSPSSANAKGLFINRTPGCLVQDCVANDIFAPRPASDGASSVSETSGFYARIAGGTSFVRCQAHNVRGLLPGSRLAVAFFLPSGTSAIECVATHCDHGFVCLDPGVSVHKCQAYNHTSLGFFDVFAFGNSKFTGNIAAKNTGNYTNVRLVSIPQTSGGNMVFSPNGDCFDSGAVAGQGFVFTDNMSNYEII